MELTVPGYEYQEICDVSQPTANRDIQDMLDKKTPETKWENRPVGNLRAQFLIEG